MSGMGEWGSGAGKVGNFKFIFDFGLHEVREVMLYVYVRGRLRSYMIELILIRRN